MEFWKFKRACTLGYVNKCTMVLTLFLFFSLEYSATTWTNQSQAWENERGNDRYVLGKCSVCLPLQHTNFKSVDYRAVNLTNMTWNPQNGCFVPPYPYQHRKQRDVNLRSAIWKLTYFGLPYLPIDWIRQKKYRTTQTEKDIYLRPCQTWNLETDVLYVRLLHLCIDRIW